MLEQEVLAEMLASGEYERHVRKMVGRMRRGHDGLVAQMREQFGERADLGGVNAGLHLYVHVHNGMPEGELIARAAAEGARVYEASPYWLGGGAPGDARVIVGFSSIELGDVADGVCALRRAWLG